VAFALPFEELAVGFKRQAVFGYASARKSREGMDFAHVPIQFAFCFPFLVCHSTDAIEIRNLVDPLYYELLKKPSNQFMRAVVSDGKDIIAAEGRQVYVLAPNSTNYWTQDPAMLREVRKYPSDKILFIRYLNTILREQSNPFSIFLETYGDTFVERFSNPEDVDFKIVKKEMKKSLRKMYNVVLSYFKHFKIKTCRQLLFGVLQTNFYAKIYWILFAMITCKYKQQDLDYFEQVQKYQHFSPADMGVNKQFWLMEQSLEDPPKKKSVDQLSDSAASSRNRTRSETSKPNDGDTTDPYDDEPDYDYAVFITNEGGAVRMDLPYFPRKSTELNSHARSKPKRQNISEALREVIDDSQALSLNVEADFYELIDPLSGSKKLGEGIISVDSKNRLTIKLKNSSTELFYVRPDKHFSFSGNSLSISWQQKQTHYKLLFEEEYDYETANEQMSLWMNIQRDDPSRHKSDSEQEAQTDILAPETTLKEPSFKKGNRKNSKTQRKPLKLTESSEFLQLAEIPVAENPLGPIPVPTAPVPTPIPEPALPPVTPRDTVAPMARSLFDDSDDDKNDVLYEPHNNHSGLANLSSSDILKFDEAPYYRAIQSLKKISHLKSPRDKLGCILITFMDIIQCVTDFWESHDREPVVGADDLVPIFSYVILKARVPKLYSEMTFIWEFATDTEMKGKYGYGFATFQIGVEVVSRLTLDELDRKKILETPISQQMKENEGSHTRSDHESTLSPEPQSDTTDPTTTDPAVSPATTSPDDSFVDSPYPKHNIKGREASTQSKEHTEVQSDDCEHPTQSKEQTESPSAEFVVLTEPLRQSPRITFVKAESRALIEGSASSEISEEADIKTDL